LKAHWNESPKDGYRLRPAVRRLVALAAWALLLPRLMADVPSLVLIQSTPGRFEIAAVDATVGHGVAALAEEAWRLLEVPLALPDEFPTPIFVRVLPASDRASPSAPFRAGVEAGGIVSSRLRADAATPPIIRRMLVQALLVRIAVARHGVTPSLTVPFWLEQACAGWWETRASAAQLDALKQISARQSPPSMESLLGWHRGIDDSVTNLMAAIWLLTFFQSESGPAEEWPTLLLRLLNGEDPLASVAASYPGRFNSAEERELWWQTGYHHVRRTRTLPSLEAADSRTRVRSLARFVFAGPTEGDMIVPLPLVLARASEPIVQAEIARRAAELTKLIPSLHPFYRNAGLSLHEAFVALAASPKTREAAGAAFEHDWRDAVELESVTRAALDALESGADVGGLRPGSLESK